MEAEPLAEALPQEIALEANISPPRTVSTPEEIDEYVREYAPYRGVDAEEVLAVLKCESNLNKDAVGDNGRSFGVAQIFLPAHPDISEEQALDPEFSIRFIVDAFAAKEQRMWTCARILGYAL